MLGELPVQRVNAFFEHKSSLGTFRNNSFCKRSCLFCVLHSDTVVLDSEFHWIFDCGQFSSLRTKYPHLSDVLRNIRENSLEKHFSIDTDLRNLFRLIRDDTKCGCSLASFIRQATVVRKTWLGEVCVRGRLCAPPQHWNRNIFSQPLADTDIPEAAASEFDSGRPWQFADLVR